MLYAGKNIQSATDTLQKITEDYLYNSIRNPRPEILSQIRQLRIVKQLDEKRYRELKRQLPYIVCSCFNPPQRRTDNFQFAESFMLDIDHIQEKGLDMETLRKKLCADEQVMMLFASPSDDGLKVLFRLAERCYDSGVYKLFYKSFASQKAAEWNIEQVVDAKTCDVARACFISVDENAYYNPNATPIKCEDYMDMNDTASLMDLKHEIESVAVMETLSFDNPRKKDPDKEAMDRIKATLSLKKKQVKENPDVFVPQILNDIQPSLIAYIDEMGVKTETVKNIQFGKKMSFSLGFKEAEINLFFGKKGFSVVQSPRCGTSPELNALMADMINTFLAENI